MQGRVFTLLGSASMAMSPLSLIIAGPFADAFGVRWWFVLGGALTTVLAMTSFVNRPLLAVEDGRTPEPENAPVLLETAVQPE
jgi:DHA3 family macrolide efflux protein-like MFS transporter